MYTPLLQNGLAIGFALGFTVQTPLVVFKPEGNPGLLVGLEHGQVDQEVGLERYTFQDGKIAMKDVYRKPA